MQIKKTLKPNPACSVRTFVTAGNQSVKQVKSQASSWRQLFLIWNNSKQSLTYVHILIID